MKKSYNRLISAMLALMMVLSIVLVKLPVDVFASYSTSYNSGVRDEICTSLDGTGALSYYTSSYAFDTLSQQGSNQLLQSLRTLMTNTHKTISSYDDCKEYADRTDCQNGDGTVLLLYTSYSATMSQWNGWNREHVWPQSLGGGNTTGGGADLHHIRPSDAVVNSTRGNKKYGNADGGNEVQGKNPATGYLGGYYSGNYFEPLDNVKGDVARICLYVYVRWGSNWGADSITEVFESVDVLLEWMELDPVDTWEMGRNEVVENIQGNRNVFIDYPEYAWLLFGEEVPENLTSPSNGDHDSSTPSTTPSTTPTTPTTPSNPTDPTDPVVPSGTTATMVSKDLGLDNGADFPVVTLANGGITISADKNGGTQTRYYDSGEAVRLYGKNILTIEPTAGYTMTSIKFTTAEQIPANAVFENASIAEQSTTTTVVVPTDGTKKVTLTNPDSKGHYKIVSIEITYATSGGDTEEPPASCTHSWTDATCTSPKTCSLCGETEGEKLSHNYEGVITLKPTATQNGITTYTCTLCGASYTEEIPATGVTQGGWTLVTDVSELTDGDQVVIVAKDYDFALSTNQKSNNRGQAAVTKSGNTITFGDDVQILVLKDGTIDGTFAFYTGSGYLYAASSSSNYLRTEANLSDNSSFAITIADEVATIVAQGTNSHNTMQYNQGSSLFAVYSSASQKAVSLYKLIVACEHSYDAVVTDPTCTAGGYTTYTCSACGDCYTDDATEATGHAWGEGVVTTEPTTEATGVMTYTCGNCGATYTEEIPMVEVPEGPVVDETLVMRNDGALNLAAYIGAQFSVTTEIAEKYDTVYIVITHNGEEKTFELTKDSTGAIYFAEYGIAAKQMADAIDIALFATKDGVTYVGQVIEGWTIKAKLVGMLDQYYQWMSYGGAYKTTPELAAAMLAYGAAAQNQFSYNLDNLATDGVNADYLALVPTEAPAMEAMPTFDNTGFQASLYNPAFMLDDVIKASLTFAIGDAKIENYKARVTINGVTEDYVLTQYVAGGTAYPGYAYIIIDSIVAADLRNDFTVTIMNGETAVSTTYTFSMENMAAKLMASRPDMITAIMNYADAAHARFRA